MYTITICSSVRFASEFEAFADALRKKGIYVYIPEDMKLDYSTITNERIRHYVGAGLTVGFFEKIRKSDAILVFNKDGYIGMSVTMEMAYAFALGKKIFAIEPDREAPRNVLVDQVLSTPEEVARVVLGSIS